MAPATDISPLKRVFCIYYLIFYTLKLKISLTILLSKISTSKKFGVNRNKVVSNSN